MFAIRRRWQRASPARRFLVGACGLSLLALVSVGALLGARTVWAPVGLHIDQGQDVHDAAIGERVYFGVQIQADGGGEVDLLAARLTGVPAGLRVVGVYGQQLYGPTDQYVGADSEEAMRLRFPLLKEHPIGDVRLPADGRPDPGWALLVVLQGTRPGRFVAGGLDVTARQGGRQSTVHSAYRLGLTVRDPKARIDMSQPLRINDDCPGAEAPAPSTWAGVVDRAIRAGGGEAVVSFISTADRFIWNTADGVRPTQRDVDSGLIPAIYNVLSLRVDRVLAGRIPLGPVSGLVLGGFIGKDQVGACAFPVDAPTTSARYVMVFGPAAAPIPAGVGAPALQVRDMAIITADGKVATPYGRLSLEAAAAT